MDSHKPKEKDSETELSNTKEAEKIRAEKLNESTSEEQSNYIGEGFWGPRYKLKELSPEEIARGKKRTFLNKLWMSNKDAYTPTPLGGLITMILGILGLLQIYLMDSGGYGYYWNIVKNLPSNIWNEIVTFFSKLF